MHDTFLSSHEALSNAKMNQEALLTTVNVILDEEKKWYENDKKPPNTVSAKIFNYRIENETESAPKLDKPLPKKVF